MKSALILFLILIVALPSNGQEADRSIDVLHLTSGVKLRGKILQYQPGQDMSFLDLDGTEMTIPEYQIRKIGRRNLRPIKQRGVYAMNEDGLYHSYTLALLTNTIGSGRGGLRGVELSGVVGHRFNRTNMVGAGIGIDFYHTFAGEMVVPIFLEVRRNILRKAVTPYVSIRGGYGIGVANPDVSITTAQGGPMINPAFGFRLGASEGMNVLMMVGVKFQKASFIYETSSSTSEVDLTYKRLQIGMAMQF